LLGWDGWNRSGSLLTAVAAIGALWFTNQTLKTTQNQIGLTEQAQIMCKQSLPRSVGALFSMTPLILSTFRGPT